jgi:polar amino acid transport system substrate-binding protein
MYGRARLLSMALVVIGCVAAFALAGFASVDEYGTNGPILGVNFTGGDGSYKKAVREGITLGISPDFPWTYQDDKTRQYAGLDVSIFREVTRRLGIMKVSWAIMPFEGLIPALQTKRIDVIVDNIHENPERLKVIDFTVGAYSYGAAVGVPKGNPKGITSWEALAGKSVGTYAGTFYQPILQSRKDLKEVKLYTTSSVEFADLLAGRVDAIVDDQIKFIQFLKSNPGANMQLTNFELPPSIRLGYARYAVRKDDVDLNWAVSRAITEMRDDGTILKFIKQIGLPASDMFGFPVQ